MVVQQFGGSVLEGFGQSSQQHGELRGVELKQSDQHHLRRLQVQVASQGGEHGGFDKDGFLGSRSTLTTYFNPEKSE